MSTGTVKQICRICLEPVEEDQCPKCKPLWYTCTEHPEYFWTDKKVCPECGPDPKAVFVETIDVGEQFWETVAEEVEEKIEQIPAPPTPPTDGVEGEDEETQAQGTSAEGTSAEGTPAGDTSDTDTSDTDTSDTDTSDTDTSGEEPPGEKALQRGA